MNKACTRCKLNKPLGSFNKFKSGDKYYYTSQCKPCRNKIKHNKRMVDPNKEKIRTKKRHLKSKYGITLEYYDELYALQQGLCKICGGHEGVLAVDHCHKTNVVRGLLCSNCNIGLGNFKDNSQLLGRAILYLRETFTDKSI